MLKKHSSSIMPTAFFIVAIFFSLVSEMDFYYKSMSSIVIFSISVTVYFFITDIKTGREWRIEGSVALTLVSSFLLLMYFLLEQGSTEVLNKVRVIAPILAGFIGVYGLVIAFLNYKRKSGIIVECGIYKKFDGFDSEILDIYFTNLKDRAVVIYDYTIDIKNVEIRRHLDKPIVLAAYGAMLDSFDCTLFFYKETVYDPGNKHVLHSNFIQTGRDIDFSDRNKNAEEEYPSEQHLHPLIFDIVNGAGEIRARTNHGIRLFKTKKEEKLYREKEVVLHPLPDPRLEEEMKKMERSFPQHYKEVVKKFDKNREGNQIFPWEKQKFIEFSEDALRRKDDSYEIDDLGFGTRDEKEKNNI